MIFRTSNVRYVLHSSKKGLQIANIKAFRKTLFTAGVVALGLFSLGTQLIFNSAKALQAPLILGQLPYQKYYVHELTDQSKVVVNVANGNMILQTNDINLAGVGPTLSVARYFNDRSTVSGSVGSHNTLGIGADIRLVSNPNGSVTYRGTSGFEGINTFFLPCV